MWLYLEYKFPGAQGPLRLLHTDIFQAPKAEAARKRCSENICWMNRCVCDLWEASAFVLGKTYPSFLKPSFWEPTLGLRQTQLLLCPGGLQQSSSCWITSYWSDFQGRPRALPPWFFRPLCSRYLCFLLETFLQNVLWVQNLRDHFLRCISGFTKTK